MRSSLAAGFLLVCLFAVLGPATAQKKSQFADRYPYLKDGANQIANTYYKGDRSKAAALGVARAACDSLKRLQADPNFEKDLQQIERGRRDAVTRANALIENITAFTDEFVRVERAILRDSDIPAPVASEIMISAADARRATKPAEFSAASIRSNVDKLVQGVCKTQSDIERGISDDKMAQKLRWVVYGFGGAVMIGADIAGSLAATPAVAVVSTSLGVTIIGNASSELLKD